MKKILFLLMTAALAASGVPGMGITGTVVNQKGKPVPNIKVELRLDYSNSRTITTDAKGAFSYTSPDGKDAKFNEIFVSAPGYAYLKTQHPYRLLQEEPVKLTLAPEEKFKGRIIDENGKPIAGAKVALKRMQTRTLAGPGFYMEGRQWQEGQVWTGAIIQEVSSGKNGYFAFDHLPADLQSIYGEMEATAPGRALVLHYIEDEDLLGNLEITIPLESKLQGTVRAPDGSVVTGGVRISVPGTNDGGWEGRSAVVGKDGTYSISKLPPGSYSVIMADLFEKEYDTGAVTGAKQNWVLPMLPVELVGGRTQTLDLQMIEGILIKGKVVDSAGAGIKDAELFVSHAGRPEEAHLFLTPHRGISEDGEFTCYVPPGNVDISPQSAGKVRFYYPEYRPHLTLTAVAGQPQTDLVFKIDVGAGEEDFPPFGKPKPVPADLALNPGTYNLVWDVNLVTGYPRGKRYTGEEAKRKIARLPKLASKRAVMYAAQLDGDSIDGCFVYAVDESRGTNAGFDTIYADLNRNRDLTDDKPFTIQKPTSRNSRHTPWFEVTSHQGPAKAAHLNNPVMLRLSANAYQGDVFVQLDRRGGWRGKIDTNKGMIDCIAEDTNADGVFGNQAALGADLQSSSIQASDKFYADINLSGRIITQMSSEMPQLLWLQQATMVAGKLYSIRLSPIGDKLTISNYTGPTGTLVVSAQKMKSYGAGIASVNVVSKAGYYNIQPYDGKPLTLPAGQYSFNRCTVSIPQAKGKQMDLDCQPDLKISVKAGKQAIAALGGKLEMLGIEPDKKVVYLYSGNSSRAGWFMSLGDNLTVARPQPGGNSYSGNDYYSYSPQAKLFDKAGRQVAASRADYT